MNERELRSNSVTLLAWVFIIIAALMTLIGIAQHLLVYWLVPTFIPELRESLRYAPALARFIAAHLHWLIGLFTALSIALMVASIGVLHRHDWARRLFINLLITGLVLLVIHLAMMTLFMAEFPLVRATLYRKQADIENFQTLIIGFNALLTIGLSAVLIWVCHYLNLPKVTVEFRGLGSMEAVAKYTPRETD